MHRATRSQSQANPAHNTDSPIIGDAETTANVPLNPMEGPQTVSPVRDRSATPSRDTASPPDPAPTFGGIFGYRSQPLGAASTPGSSIPRVLIHSHGASTQVYDCREGIPCVPAPRPFSHCNYPAWSYPAPIILSPLDLIPQRNHALPMEDYLSTIMRRALVRARINLLDCKARLVAPTPREQQSLRRLQVWLASHTSVLEAPRVPDDVEVATIAQVPLVILFHEHLLLAQHAPIASLMMPTPELVDMFDTLRETHAETLDQLRPWLLALEATSSSTPPTSPPGSPITPTRLSLRPSPPSSPTSPPSPTTRGSSVLLSEPAMVMTMPPPAPAPPALPALPAFTPPVGHSTLALPLPPPSTIFPAATAMPHPLSCTQDAMYTHIQYVPAPPLRPERPLTMGAAAVFRVATPPRWPNAVFQNMARLKPVLGYDASKPSKTIAMSAVGAYDPTSPAYRSPMDFLDLYDLQAHRVNLPIADRARDLLHGTFLSAAFMPVMRNQLDLYTAHLPSLADCGGDLLFHDLLVYHFYRCAHVSMFTPRTTTALRSMMDLEQIHGDLTPDSLASLHTRLTTLYFEIPEEERARELLISQMSGALLRSAGTTPTGTTIRGWASTFMQTYQQQLLGEGQARAVRGAMPPLPPGDPRAAKADEIMLVKLTVDFLRTSLGSELTTMAVTTVPHRDRGSSRSVHFSPSHAGYASGDDTTTQHHQRSQPPHRPSSSQEPSYCSVRGVGGHRAPAMHRSAHPTCEFADADGHLSLAKVKHARSPQGVLWAYFRRGEGRGISEQRKHHLAQQLSDLIGQPVAVSMEAARSNGPGRNSRYHPPAGTPRQRPPPPQDHRHAHRGTSQPVRHPGHPPVTTLASARNHAVHCAMQASTTLNHPSHAPVTTILRSRRVQSIHRGEGTPPTTPPPSDMPLELWSTPSPTSPTSLASDLIPSHGDAYSGTPNDLSELFGHAPSTEPVVLTVNMTKVATPLPPLDWPEDAPVTSLPPQAAKTRFADLKARFPCLDMTYLAKPLQGENLPWPYMDACLLARRDILSGHILGTMSGTYSFDPNIAAASNTVYSFLLTSASEEQAWIYATPNAPQALTPWIMDPLDASLENCGWIIPPNILQSETAIITAKKPIARHQPLYISYGHHYWFVVLARSFGHSIPEDMVPFLKQIYKRYGRAILDDRNLPHHQLHWDLILDSADLYECGLRVLRDEAYILVPLGVRYHDLVKIHRPGMPPFASYALGTVAHCTTKKATRHLVMDIQKNLLCYQPKRGHLPPAMAPATPPTHLLAKPPTLTCSQCSDAPTCPKVRDLGPCPALWQPTPMVPGQLSPCNATDPPQLDQFKSHLTSIYRQAWDTASDDDLDILRLVCDLEVEQAAAPTQPSASTFVPIHSSDSELSDDEGTRGEGMISLPLSCLQPGRDLGIDTCRLMAPPFDNETDADYHKRTKPLRRRKPYHTAETNQFQCLSGYLEKYVGLNQPLPPFPNWFLLSEGDRIPENLYVWRPLPEGCTLGPPKTSYPHHHTIYVPGLHTPARAGGPIAAVPTPAGSSNPSKQDDRSSNPSKQDDSDSDSSVFAPSPPAKRHKAAASQQHAKPTTKKGAPTSSGQVATSSKPEKASTIVRHRPKTTTSSSTGQASAVLPPPPMTPSTTTSSSTGHASAGLPPYPTTPPPRGLPALPVSPPASITLPPAPEPMPPPDAQFTHEGTLATTLSRHLRRQVASTSTAMVPFDMASVYAFEEEFHASHEQQLLRHTFLQRRYSDHSTRLRSLQQLRPTVLHHITAAQERVEELRRCLVEAEEALATLQDQATTIDLRHTELVADMRLCITEDAQLSGTLMVAAAFATCAHGIIDQFQAQDLEIPADIVINIVTPDAATIVDEALPSPTITTTVAEPPPALPTPGVTAAPTEPTDLPSAETTFHVNMARRATTHQQQRPAPRRAPPRTTVHRRRTEPRQPPISDSHSLPPEPRPAPIHQPTSSMHDQDHQALLHSALLPGTYHHGLTAHLGTLPSTSAVSWQERRQILATFNDQHDTLLHRMAQYPLTHSTIWHAAASLQPPTMARLATAQRKVHQASALLAQRQHDLDRLCHEHNSTWPSFAHAQRELLALDDQWQRDIETLLQAYEQAGYPHVRDTMVTGQTWIPPRPLRRLDTIMEAHVNTLRAITAAFPAHVNQQRTHLPFPMEVAPTPPATSNAVPLDCMGDNDLLLHTPVTVQGHRDPVMFDPLKNAVLDQAEDRFGPSVETYVQCDNGSALTLINLQLAMALQVPAHRNQHSIHLSSVTCEMTPCDHYVTIAIYFRGLATIDGYQEEATTRIITQALVVPDLNVPLLLGMDTLFYQGFYTAPADRGFYIGMDPPIHVPTCPFSEVNRHISRLAQIASTPPVKHVNMVRIPPRTSKRVPLPRPIVRGTCMTELDEDALPADTPFTSMPLQLSVNACLTTNSAPTVLVTNWSDLPFNINAADIPVIITPLDSETLGRPLPPSELDQAHHVHMVHGQPTTSIPSSDLRARPYGFPEDLWEHTTPLERTIAQSTYQLYSKERLDEILVAMAKMNVYEPESYAGRRLRAQAYANIDRFFHIDAENPPLALDEEFSIETTGSVRCHARLKRWPMVQLAFGKAKTNRLMRHNKLERSTSSTSLNLVLVPYPERIQKFLDTHGDDAYTAMFDPKYEDEVSTFYRLTVDLRPVNELTIPDVFPLPRTQDLLDAARGSEIFCLSDIEDAFFTILLNPAHRHLTAFTTPHGHFQFKVCPQGASNAAQYFARMVQRVFADIPTQCLLVFQDDICPHASNIEKLLDIMQLVYDRLRAKGLILKLSKTYFGYPSVTFLGHVLSAEGRRPCPKKTAAITELAMPTTVAEIQSFIGMALFYCDYIPNFSSITMPLYAIASKGTNVAEVWTEQHAAAINAIKAALTTYLPSTDEASTPTVLRLPDFNAPFRLHIDACKQGRGLGAILLQQSPAEVLAFRTTTPPDEQPLADIDINVGWHPVAYWSKALTASQRNYSATELESMALHHAILHFSAYLQNGRSFDVFTDHQALVYMTKRPVKTSNGRLARYALDLQSFRFRIFHREGVLNKDADAVSRLLREASTPDDYPTADDLQTLFGPPSQLPVSQALEYCNHLVPQLPNPSHSIILAAHAVRLRRPPTPADATYTAPPRRTRRPKTRDVQVARLDLPTLETIPTRAPKVPAESLPWGDITIAAPLPTEEEPDTDWDDVMRATEVLTRHQYLIDAKYVDPETNLRMVITRLVLFSSHNIPAGYVRYEDAHELPEPIAIQGPGGLAEHVELYYVDTASIPWPTSEQDMALLQRGDPLLALSLERLRTDGADPSDTLLAARPMPDGSSLLTRTLLARNPYHNNDAYQIVVPADLRPPLMDMYHRGWAHLGYHRMLKTVALTYYWQGMGRDIKQHIRQCTACHLRKPYTGPSPPLQVYPKLTRPFEQVHVDLTGPLPTTSNGYDYIIVFKCALTKWVEIFPITSKHMDRVADCFIDEVYCRHGAPSRIISDRGTEFENKLIRDLCRLLQVRKISTTPGRPQSDGQVERHMGTLKDGLFHFINNTQTDWDLYLPVLAHAYRTTVNEATGYTPFYMLYGREARQPHELWIQSFSELPDIHTYVANLAKLLNWSWHETGDRLVLQAERRAERPYESHTPRPFTEYKVGDLVYIARVPKRDIFSEADGRRVRIAAKLQARYTGPHRIIAMCTPVLYRISVAGTIKTVHASKMKPAHNNETLCMEHSRPHASSINDPVQPSSHAGPAQVSAETTPLVDTTPHVSDTANPNTCPANHVLAPFQSDVHSPQPITIDIADAFTQLPLPTSKEFVCLPRTTVTTPPSTCPPGHVLMQASMEPHTFEYSTMDIHDAYIHLPSSRSTDPITFPLDHVSSTANISLGSSSPTDIPVSSMGGGGHDTFKDNEVSESTRFGYYSVLGVE